ncbi:heme oxygenase-like protein [Glonium stellatum]|uniref:Heme oxygenase-like protein n=1 Tax=Glonium stellatum TaxID=574774 RepID=A0A8E2JWH5_9PEZI|nr:heme oxygenase-like protein [Glonium stellatum]
MAKDPVPPSSLPGEINIASRSLHTQLNRLITSRLPLGLPPHTSSPTLYTTGLLHFAHIYLTFESLWQDLLPPPSHTTSPSSPLLSFLLVDPWDADPGNTNAPTSPQMLEFLRNLRPKGLSRSGRLRRDLKALTGLSETDLSVQLSQFPGAKVQEYCAHIRKAVAQKPHVLVAYAWCYYMAVFSGGRWIRSELMKAGEGFWQGGGKKVGDDVPLGEAGLSFFSFPGTEDGEDIKAEFKERLAAAEGLFTAQEREEVVAEAAEIFKYSASLVRELDELLATSQEELAAAEAAEKDKERTEERERAAVRPRRRPRTWLRRPGIIGMVVALSCVAWLAVYHMGVQIMP